MIASPVRYQVPLLTASERSLLDRIPTSLAAGLDLLGWWRNMDESGSFRERFPLIRNFNRPTSGFGFFDTATVGGRDIPIMGATQDMLFDRTDSTDPAAVENARQQFKEFVLRYMLRSSSYLQPRAWSTTPGQLYSNAVPFSPCARGDENRAGFGYSQLYFKLRDDFRIGKFSERQSPTITDLREVQSYYDWLLLSVRIFSFNLSYAPGGSALPSVNVPLHEDSRVILAPQFLTVDETECNGRIAEYGFGYALLNEVSESSALSYGPGRFQAGFQLIQFRLLNDGQTFVRTVFVANRPDRIVNPGALLSGLIQPAAQNDRYSPTAVRTPATLVLPDPVIGGIWAANLITNGEAGDSWCISVSNLLKGMLVEHFQQHYQMITGALLTWRQVLDWRDGSTIPEWIKLGKYLGVK
jgi:hypothetical protein